MDDFAKTGSGRSFAGPAADDVRRRWIAVVVMAVVPLVIFLTAVAMLGSMAPFATGLAGLNYDPSYQYLFNGVGLMEGYAPRHIDHPGTPVQILVGCLTLLAWLVRSGLGLDQAPYAVSVAQDAEFYLRVVALAFAAANAAAIGWLGWLVLKYSRDPACALLTQSGYLLLWKLFPRIFYVAPESILILAAVGLAATMAPRLFEGRRATVGEAITGGFFIALGFTAKINFAPLILVVLVSDPRAIVVGTIAGVIFGFLFFLPIIGEINYVLRWFKDIAMHTGSYGTGSAGIVDWSAVPSRFLAILGEIPLFLLAMVGLLVAGLKDRRAWILALMGGAQLAMVLKHFSPHYMVPFVALCPLLLAWSLSRIDRRAVPAAAFGCLLLGGGLLVWFALDLRSARAARDADVAAIRRVLAQHPDALVVGTYHCHLPDYAMKFAIGSVDPDFAARYLAGQHPDNVMYYPGERQLTLPYNVPVDARSLFARHARVLLVAPAALPITIDQVSGRTLFAGEDKVVELLPAD
jgi:hypothetical protein